jgi:hypothetical protein
VHVVDSVGQWQNLLAKAAASNRVVVVQFFQVRSEGLCHVSPGFDISPWH